MLMKVIGSGHIYLVILFIYFKIYVVVCSQYFCIHVHIVCFYNFFSCQYEDSVDVHVCARACVRACVRVHVRACVCISPLHFLVVSKQIAAVVYFMLP